MFSSTRQHQRAGSSQDAGEKVGQGQVKVRPNRRADLLRLKLCRGSNVKGFECFSYGSDYRLKTTTATKTQTTTKTLIKMCFYIVKNLLNHSTRVRKQEKIIII